MRIVTLMREKNAINLQLNAAESRHLLREWRTSEDSR